jgi:TolB protein
MKTKYILSDVFSASLRLCGKNVNSGLEYSVSKQTKISRKGAKTRRFIKFPVYCASYVLFALFISPAIFAQQKPLGLFESNSDVGTVKKAGKATYDAASGQYSLEGSGGRRGDFQFVWKRLKGDFILTARAKFVGKSRDPRRKMGLIIRAGLETDAAQAGAVVHADGLTALQFRRAKGADTGEIKSEITAADVIQLQRKGDKFIMSVARFGEPFVTTQISDIALGDNVYAGLFISSDNAGIREKAVFDDVRLTVPAKDDFVPYRDYIGSNLEILDVAGGTRKVIYSVADSLQAPNWTPDGQALVYNRNGRLYRFDLGKNSPTEIDADFAVNNNNDHVLSFDGKWMGISNHSPDDNNQSVIYVLPAAGGKPQRITAKAPSYLHGWSPDGAWLVYTGGRGGNFDIYKISSKGGEEIRLTDSEALDDGPEFDPGGKYIYFNSTRGGLMQIWRMKPDGSEQTRITTDEFNNWFPHVSPDGKWLMMISYLKGDVAPAEHPFYKQVYLRVMPVTGGKPKVVAYVYGGQGTINVPSWSPDSRRVAFVSNSEVK